MALSDAELVQRVTQVAAQRLPPDRVEAAVGETPWINTTRATDRLALQSAEISADDEQQPVPRLTDARDVVYWGRPIESRNPRVIGIAWFGDGRVETFSGMLLPPV